MVQLTAKPKVFVRFPRLCSHCIRVAKAHMMTGYGLTAPCQICGNYADVALCELPHEAQPCAT